MHPFSKNRRFSSFPFFQHSNIPILPHGFTLLEMMISIVILVIAITIASQTFSAATRAWTSARVIMDKSHHGDFILGQLSHALRSMTFFESTADKYGFRIEDNRTGLGKHSISWVTASSAFVAHGTEFEHGLHRIEVGGGRDDDGNEGLLVSVWSHFADEDDVEKKSWLISETIQGLRCEIYDIEEEQWSNEWEDTNAIPGLIEITLYAEPAEDHDDPIEYRQLIEIPRGPRVTNDVSEAR